jgi:cysteine desulfurase/selenocysteine lyase
VRYVNLDNAASTPPLVSVAAAVADLLPYYASVHRGDGFKSRLCTEAYEVARHRVSQHVGADPERDVVVFGKNTTEAINKLAHRLPTGGARRPGFQPAPGDERVILTTLAEHHSNLLPWRARGPVEHVAVDGCGAIDEDHFDRQLRRFAGRVDLVAVTGASNVTGLVPPIHRLAAKAHAVGAPILVDAAQLAPHRPIDMGAHDDPGHIDYLALSGHKLYAPYGTGALIGPRSTFAHGAPEYQGGGTVAVVTEEGVIWDDAPARDEAGSPNVIGAVALGVALATLDAIGMDVIAANEHRLLQVLTAGLAGIEGVRLHGPTDPEADRVGVVPFEVDGMDHRLVAARLAFEHGIGVRSGCFCAQPLVANLLRTPPVDLAAWTEDPRRGRPGLVRASLGCYSDHHDLDRLLTGLAEIVERPPCRPYALDAGSQFVPDGHAPWLPPRVRALLTR